MWKNSNKCIVVSTLLLFGILGLVQWFSRSSIQKWPKNDRTKTDQGDDDADSNAHTHVSSVSSPILIPTIPIGVDIFGNVVNKPVVGAGTWQYNDTIAYESVCKAFLAGYTMVDTAWGYHNQKGVGLAIQDCWKRPRNELFVMTKIPGGLTRDETWAYHNENLKDLNLRFVDHLMTHYPADWQATPERASRERRQEQWKALQEIYESSQARSIGVSHYCPQHLDDVLQVSDICTPSINQVEYHVGSGDVDAVIAKCRQHNITFMSFSPLCGPCEYEAKDSLISGELVTDIAKQYNVTGSQVALRFIVQQALLSQDNFIGGVIPKSNNLEHLVSNRNLFDFSLSKEDMQRLFQAFKPAAEAGDCEVP